MAMAFPCKGGHVYVVYGENARDMAKRLLVEAGVPGAIPRGAKISLKPNLVVSKPAAEGATTHPEILAGIIECLREHGHGTIEILESSWLGDDTGRAFAVCGMTELAKRYDVRLVDLKKDESVAVATPGGPVRVCRRALEADFLINLPVLKGHCQTRMTCAIKNMKGCIPDAEKRRFHRDGLNECIAAMAAAIVPNVTVVDGLCGDLDFEEGGNPVRADRMLLAGDPVKLDAYCCSLMGLSTADVGYIPLAERYGVGETACAPADIVELNRPEAVGPAKAAGKVGRLAKHIQADRACSACYANAIRALDTLSRSGAGVLPSLTIGQGWRGKTAPGIGVGDCCQGGKGSIPGCPPTARQIVESLG